MLLLLALAVQAPPRDAGISYLTSRTVNELQACIVRKLAHQGTPLAVPADGGIDIDLSQPTPLGQIANEARYSVQIRDNGQVRHIAVTYRHPYSVKAAATITRGIAKRCFPEVLAR